MDHQYSENLSSKEKINLETSTVAWTELQRFFAGGYTLCVAPELDLVEVARLMVEDNADYVSKWIDSGQLAGVSDQQAKEWVDAEAIVWAVVIKPWVLVQSHTSGESSNKDSS